MADATTKLALTFAATETVRPDVIRRSLESFRANLLGVDWTASVLHLNIDPLPSANGRDEIAAIAGELFGRVSILQPEEPNFAQAVKETWSRAGEGPLFYLQMDWLLLRPVEIGEMVSLLDTDPDLAAVNLWRSVSHARAELLCLSPVLIRGAVARDLARRLNTDVGPEAQLRDPGFRPGGRSLGTGLRSVHWPRDYRRTSLRDIGRDWMRAHGWSKEGGSGFIRWTRNGSS